MSLAKASKSIATVALRDRAANDERVFRGTQSASWDPYEVWLTRVKQPRDRAVQVVIPVGPRARSWGYIPSGIVGVLLVIVLVVFLLGRL